MISPTGNKINENELNPYYSIRKYIKTGDLLSWHSYGFIGKCVRFFTKGTVNHSSLCIDSIEYGNGRKFCIEAMETGVELNVLSRRLDNFKGKVYWHPLNTNIHSYRKEIGTAAFKNLGVGYDFRSIFKQMFGRVSISAKKLFCSEEVYLSFVDAYVPDARRNVIAPNPQELYTTHQFWGNPILIKE